MRSVITTVALLTVIVSCKSQNDGQISTDIISNPVSANGVDTTGKPYPKILLEETTFDFGTILQGEKAEHLFKIKNTGTSDLIISSAEGSCGCTVPEYSKQPIKPGQESFVKVIFDSDGKYGKQHKTVTLITNTYPNINRLNIIGNVLKPETK